ncbi:MAG: hypothetical protein MK138_06895, partial [Planctomycetes bacterium]|nr:hypothetical protein [Planctomycetota bacterium]MCH2584476.1 hypothetical protein [Planctomycetota bacterium]
MAKDFAAAGEEHSQIQTELEGSPRLRAEDLLRAASGRRTEAVAQSLGSIQGAAHPGVSEYAALPTLGGVGEGSGGGAAVV